MGTLKGRESVCEMIYMKVVHMLQKIVIKYSVFKIKCFNPGCVKKKACTRNLEICKTLLGVLFCVLFCLELFYTSEKRVTFFITKQ